MSRLLVATLLIAASGCLADIRPEPLNAVETPSAQLEQRGRDLLRTAATAHGAAAFAGYDTYELEVEDHWKGLLGRAGNPWPDNLAHIALHYRANSFDGRATFLGGKKEGWTWGMQSWKTYEASPDGEVRFKKNKDARFILAAVQYLNEFVFRDHRDNVVAYGGTETLDGVRYEKVYVTWTSMEPSKQHDQYVAYIEPATGLVRKLHYTVREYAGFIQATMHYDDFVEVSGVMVPSRQSITTKPSDSADDYLHRITVKKAQFGTPPVSTFVVDEGLGLIGDQKLAMD